MSDTKWRTVRIPNLLAEQVDSIFEQAGYPSRSSLIQDAVRRRLEELRRQVETDKTFTEKEKLQLTKAANEIARSLRCLEEEDVREHLEDNYHWWPKEKIERGVQFICSLKIKNN